MAIAVIMILAILILKYRFVYKVTISGEDVGYVIDKYEFEKLIDEELVNLDDESIAYVEVGELPTYKLVIKNSSVDTNEEEIFNKLDEEKTITYKIYAIAINGRNISYVDTIDDAEEAVAEIKKEYDSKLEEVDITVNEFYTKDKNQVEQTVELASAVETTQEEVYFIVEQQEKIKSATLDGVYFGIKPVTGNITSRYGDSESIRSHAHSGLDIAAPAGTDIVAAADGEVTFSGTMGGYGNLIIITHKNGIQTYYGHCSKLYAKEGDVVEAGELIAAVGSTGFSTGNHLHFEIRKDGSTLNPQKYLYK